MRAVVLGASGYAGAELLRLMADHSQLEVVAASAESAVGVSVKDRNPNLAAAYPDTRFVAHEVAATSDAEVVFCALPHGVSQDFVGPLRRDGRIVVDLGGDYRLRDGAAYEEWYDEPHRDPVNLPHAVYALVERHRSQLVGCEFLSVPGCYPTATILGVGPFVDAGWVPPRGLIVDALSGASGAGRVTRDGLHFSQVYGNVSAYGLLRHRHTIEMQQELGVELLFTPHLLPVSRGLLVTAYAPLESAHTTDDALEVLRSAYDGEAFVVVTREPPALKDPLGSNLCFVSARVDERTRTLVVMSAIDNLVKGAAGQALQALNVALGWSESDGLSRVGVTP